MIRIAIIQFPGSNCERESAIVVKKAGMEPVEFLWNEPAEELTECDGFFLVGGFSYEDRSRAGIIASLDPVMATIEQEGEKGKPVLGICNGAQILVEAGLVPGLKDHKLGMALASNQRMKDGHVLGTGYYNVWTNVKLTVRSHRSLFTRHLEREQWMRIPVAHAEGRFMMPEDLLTELKANDQTIFRYCDDEGNAVGEFPVNPNGSMDNLAAVCNGPGNIMAMMPHPERSGGGDPIFTSMRDSIRENTRISATTLQFDPPSIFPVPYSAPTSSFELLVDLIITDNEAVSVENALRHLGLSVTVGRQTHWEIVMDSDPDETVKNNILATGELFNSNKEFLATRPASEGTISLLVRYKDDMVGQHKREVLRNWFHIEGIRTIKKGVAWTIIPEDGRPDEVLKKILDTHILFNPFSHDCFYYA